MSRGPGPLARAVLAELAAARGGRASVEQLLLALDLHRRRLLLTRSLRRLERHGLVRVEPADGRVRCVLLSAAITDRGRNYAGRTP